MQRQTGVLLAGLALVCAGCTGNPPPAALVFCYETLVDTACYLNPDPNHVNRLIGVYSVDAATVPALILKDVLDGKDVI